MVAAKKFKQSLLARKGTLKATVVPAKEATSKCKKNAVRQRKLSTNWLTNSTDQVPAKNERTQSKRSPARVSWTSQPTAGQDVPNKSRQQKGPALCLYDPLQHTKRPKAKGKIVLRKPEEDSQFVPGFPELSQIRYHQSQRDAMAEIRNVLKRTYNLAESEIDLPPESLHAASSLHVPIASSSSSEQLLACELAPRLEGKQKQSCYASQMPPTPSDDEETVVEDTDSEDLAVAAHLQRIGKSPPLSFWQSPRNATETKIPHDQENTKQSLQSALLMPDCAKSEDESPLSPPLGFESDAGAFSSKSECSVLVFEPLLYSSPPTKKPLQTRFPTRVSMHTMQMPRSQIYTESVREVGEETYCPLGFTDNQLVTFCHPSSRARPEWDARDLSSQASTKNERETEANIFEWLLDETSDRDTRQAIPSSSPIAELLDLSSSDKVTIITPKEDTPTPSRTTVLVQPSPERLKQRKGLLLKVSTPQTFLGETQLVSEEQTMTAFVDDSQLQSSQWVTETAGLSTVTTRNMKSAGISEQAWAGQTEQPKVARQTTLSKHFALSITRYQPEEDIVKFQEEEEFLSRHIARQRIKADSSDLRHMQQLIDTQSHTFIASSSDVEEGIDSDESLAMGYQARRSAQDWLLEDT